MTEFRVCESYDMAIEVFDDHDGSPCFDRAEHEIHDFWLCDECAWAFSMVVEMGEQVLERDRLKKTFFGRVRIFFMKLWRKIKKGMGWS